MGSLKFLSQIYTVIFWLFVASILLIFLYRAVTFFRNRSTRTSFPDLKGHSFTKALKILLGVAMFLMIINSPFYVYIASSFHSIVPAYLNHLLVGSIILMAGFECFLTWKFSEKLLQKTYKKVFLAITVFIALPLSVYLVYYIPVMTTYPSTEESYIIELPVRGTWQAGHAGESQIVNYHSAIDAQKYAMDIVKVNTDRQFFKNAGTEIKDFFSLGEPVYSPVDGTIVQAVDSLSNAEISFESSNTENPAGNHLVIEFESSRYLFLAHLDSASVQVQAGDTVHAGMLIANVGNSGNTSWPHLHLHIQDKPDLGNESAVGYPYRFDSMNRKRWFTWRKVTNGFLLRNDLFESVDS